MNHSKYRPWKLRDDRGIAVLLLLFAMSAFSVLGVAALTTDLGAAPPGQSFSIFRGVADGSLTKFVAPMVVPNAWRVQGGNGSYAFQLPVFVPETSGDPSQSTAAWHVMSESEVPGLEVCCESRAGACAQRRMGEQTAHIEDWSPGADDALRLSLNVTTRPDATAQNDSVLATVMSGAAVAADGAPIACQLELHRAVIGKGTAYLRQTPRQDGSALGTDLIEGRFDIAVRIR
jgi:hypothetical protein